ncbi:hypothetical protein PR001_g27701 [Phytophthora rubi]|uniref:Uncharacterized protein n=1 Tax=Phytophthora rubi TaxID=129364 RepID=A0A6A3HFH4_9STRA|nr:hypothetical protein PR001_g27701 [Phytophthora rubi]
MGSTKAVEIGRGFVIHALEGLQIFFSSIHPGFSTGGGGLGVIPLLDQTIGSRGSSTCTSFELRHSRFSLLQGLCGSSQAGLRQEQLMFSVFTRPIQVVPIFVELLDLVACQPHFFGQVITLILESVALEDCSVEARLEVAEIRLLLPEL